MDRLFFEKNRVNFKIIYRQLYSHFLNQFLSQNHIKGTEKNESNIQSVHVKFYDHISSSILEKTLKKFRQKKELNEVKNKKNNLN